MIGYGPRFPRRIAHFDLDTFFVAVERLHDRSLRGRPVLVGGRGPRSVVASASYEAREYGCHSAQPMMQALRLCPRAVVVPPSLERYREASRVFHALLRELSPVVESAGIDEAYVDLTGAGGRRDGAAPAARDARARVRDELGLAVSVCVAGSRTTAKVGSDRAKPDGWIEVPEGADAAFLAPLPLRELPLVGPRLGERLGALGVHTIGDAAALDRRWLEHRFGRTGALLHDRARGADPAPVLAGRRPARSVSREVTFDEDVTDEARLRRALRRHAESVARDLRRDGRMARTVTLKLRWSDFATLTRRHTMARPSRSSTVLLADASALLEQVLEAERGRPVRLVGLGAANLVEGAVQLAFGEAGPLHDERLAGALDGIRRRFGASAVRQGP